MHLSAACSHVVDIFNTLRKGHVDSRKISPHRLCPDLVFFLNGRTFSQEYSAESRDRTGSQHDIQCSEPAAVVLKSLRTAGRPEICRRPEPEALKSGLAVVVQCGGTPS